MIFLHDSMFINRLFRDKELDGDIKFHWHFSKNEVIDIRKINSYVSLLKNNKELQSTIVTNNLEWNGCFGAASICNLSLIEYLEEKYDLFKILLFSSSLFDSSVNSNIFLMKYECKTSETQNKNFPNAY